MQVFTKISDFLMNFLLILQFLAKYTEAFEGSARNSFEITAINSVKLQKKIFKHFE